MLNKILSIAGMLAYSYLTYILLQTTSLDIAGYDLTLLANIIGVVLLLVALNANVEIKRCDCDKKDQKTDI